jgi:cytochrome c oxidase subunit III
MADAAVPTLDVGRLPPIALGPRAPLWWGVVLMVVIEGTMMAILVASYFYVANNFHEWPPLGTRDPALGPGAAVMALLVVSVLPQYWADALAFRASQDGDERLVRWVLVAACVLGVAPSIVRIYEFQAFDCRWDSHVYGSVVWTLLGIHTVHLVASTLETIVLTVYLFFYPLDAKHRLDLEVNSVYWYFVVGGWLPCWALLYFAPRLL